MKLLTGFLVLTFAVLAMGEDGAVLPNAKLTPGVVRTTDANEICRPGFSTKAYRHTTPAMKAQVYRAYHRAKKAGVCCEVDHLIPLELGGADDVRNLWPQPYQPAPGAHEKDKVENYLRERVCSGDMPLHEAQAAIRGNWFAVYQKIAGGTTRRLIQ